MTRNFVTFNWTNIRKWWDISSPDEAEALTATGAVVDGKMVHIPRDRMRRVGVEAEPLVSCRDVDGIEWALVWRAPQPRSGYEIQRELLAEIARLKAQAAE